MCTQNECLQFTCTCFSFNQVWNNFNRALNPFECVGIAHNEALKHLEGRSVQGELEGSYNFLNSFLAGRYHLPMQGFLPWGSIQNAFIEVVQDGHLYYSKLIREAIGSEKRFLEKLESILLNANNRGDFERKIDKLVRKISGQNMDRQTQAKLLGLVALAKHSVTYWNAISRTNIFDQDVQTRRGGKFWADLGGFAVGFVGTLIYNNNGGSGNPFGNGVSVGTMASASVK